MKKLFAFLTIAMAASLLVSCGNGKKGIRVGFSQIGAESDWRKASTESIQSEAKKRGIDLRFSDAQQKQENQIKAIDTFINQKVDIISFSPVVSSGFEDILKKAKAAGIPVILFDRGVDVSEEGLYKCFIGSDFVEEGRRAARWVLENVKPEDGKVVGIAELVGTVGSAPATERQKGFLEILADNPSYKVIKSQTGDFTRSQGKEVMEQFLKSPEADQIKVLFAHNDDMALGAIQAIEEAGKKPGKDIIIIGIDGVKAMFEAILAGKANCTVECNPLIGGTLFDVVEKYIASGKDDSSIPPRIVSPEGVFDTKSVTAEVVAGRKY